MKKDNVDKLFDEYLNKESIFKNKKVLQLNYTPETIKHRDEEIQEIVKILSPILKGNKPSNLFIYGKTGTGKTLTIKYISTKLQNLSEEKKIPLKLIYVNCKLKKVVDTEYRLLAHLARKFGKAIPITGLPTDEVYNIFFESVDNEERPIILILDEMDQLIKKTGDEILYNLTRMNAVLKNSQITIVGISNDLNFTNNLDPRIKSSLSEEKIFFPAYDALQIQDILKERTKAAFKKKIIEDGVIQKCAAYAAREHGDARRALELIRVAGEIAERKNKKKIRMKDLDEADEKIEKDKVIDAVTKQPKQFQLVLYSVIINEEKQKKKGFYTGDIYDYYKKLCNSTNQRPLTQRRVSDIIAELDMLGIINATVISNGRYGRTRQINLSIHQSLVPKTKEILQSELGI